MTGKEEGDFSFCFHMISTRPVGERDSEDSLCQFMGEKTEAQSVWGIRSRPHGEKVSKGKPHCVSHFLSEEPTSLTKVNEGNSELKRPRAQGREGMAGETEWLKLKAGWLHQICTQEAGSRKGTGIRKGQEVGPALMPQDTHSTN